MTLIPYAGKDPCDLPFATASKFGPQISQASAKAQANPVKPSARHVEINSKPTGSYFDREKIRNRILSLLRDRGMPVWARKIVEDVANRHVVGIEFLAVKCMARRVVVARNEAIYLIKAHRPMLSALVIGRWFDKDHTTILYALASHSDRTGDAKLTTYDLNMPRKRNAAFIRWKQIQARRKAA